MPSAGDPAPASGGAADLPPPASGGPAGLPPPASGGPADLPPPASGGPADLPPLVVIGGATATGKTGLALAVAEQLMARGIPAEIVSADSRQVYRGLDIGTAKATPEERGRVVHHGLDLVDPDHSYTVVDFRAHALVALRALGERGGIGILAGGTGFWLRAVFAGIDTDALPSDPDVRSRIDAMLASGGLEAVASRLTEIAPAHASRIDLRNPRRVVRALEIATLRGDAPLPARIGYPAPVLGLQLVVEPAEHQRRMLHRARAQFAAGLVEEARALRERFDPQLPAFTAIGYHESWATLDGECTLEEAIARDVRRNVQFAKRQRTWFRREPALTVMDATQDPKAAVVPAVGAFMEQAPG